MGNALQNLERLLAMPSGCGEQNMVRFAPNVYIQQYLETSGQLRPDVRAKARGFLQSGESPQPPPLPAPPPCCQGQHRPVSLPSPPRFLPVPRGEAGLQAAPGVPRGCNPPLRGRLPSSSPQGTSGSCSTNAATALTAPSGRATAAAAPGEGPCRARAARAVSPARAPAVAGLLLPPAAPRLQRLPG